MKKVCVKISAAVVALIVAFFSLVYPAARVGAVANQNSTYYAYYYNGDFAGSYILNAVPVLTASQGRAMVSKDVRVASPDRNGVCKIDTCKLSTNEKGYGTGFVIDDHTIATAAHCVSNYEVDYTTTSDYAVDKIIFLSKTGEVELTIEPASIDTIHVPYNYFENGEQWNLQSYYDYALIKVDVDLSDYAEFNLGYPMESLKNMNTTIHCTGFPTYVNGKLVNTRSTKNEIYDGIGRVADVDPHYVYHGIYASEGNSGGPVYLETEYDGKVYYSVIGIQNIVTPTLNKATRMDTELLNFYKNNPNL